ncbi:ribosome biogenesis GTPase [Alteromonadaceae bacterium Bs31]|nr:ribosome biogenesis GTPase [Alteromonadaceae bacterium Bs31]
MIESHNLNRMGWQPFFQQQLSLEEWENCRPFRVVEQYRSELRLESGSQHISLPILASMPAVVVGDWLLLDEQQRYVRLLERKTTFARKAAGSKVERQLISSNVDTAFILCSMNEDFNLNRIERFLAVVNEAGAEPVVLLSKCDLAEDPESYVNKVRGLDSYLAVEALNCTSEQSLKVIEHWIKPANTIAVLGSSGVGKSSLINTLAGEQQQSTSAIREDDSKGRHTTTKRSLIKLNNGALIIDTPGMREIQLADCKEGIVSTFADIEKFAEACRFQDCQHHNEPGCAVLAAVEQGELQSRRLDNYLKLLREESLNSASLAQRRASDKALGKFYKRTMVDSNKLKGR